MIKVAVIAGTPVDTRMGVNFLNDRNRGLPEPVVEPLYYPVSESCDEQILFQYAEEEEKIRRIDQLFDAAIQEGVKDFFIYCNSLSGAFDFDAYALRKNVRIYTPLQVYRELGRQYTRVGVMAANNLSAYGIEKSLMESNDKLYMIGTGNMAVVHGIEDHLPASEIVESLGLNHLVRYMEASGCEILVLGCTHFPYLREELQKCCRIPLIDPAERMFERVLEKQQGLDHAETGQVTGA